MNLPDRRSDLLVTQVDILRDAVRPALAAAGFATIYGISANLSIIRWSHMPVKQYRGSAAEFRCQSPADPVFVPGIPLPEGLAKWHTRPCYRTIIRRWRGDFRLSDANFSLPAGKNRKFYEVARNTNAPTIMIAEKGATLEGEQARSARYQSGQAAEHGIEQGAKARALIEVLENRAGLLLENAVTDFVGSASQESTHTVLGRLHMKL